MNDRFTGLYDTCGEKINYGDIVNALKEIDQNIVIKDPRLISQLKKNEIKIEAVEGNKGYYTLD